MQPQNQMNSFNQINQTPMQNNMPVQDNTPKQKNKYKPTIIILAIVAAAGLGFGGFELWQNIKKDEEVKALQATEVSDLIYKEASQIEPEELNGSDNKYSEFVNNFTKNRYPIGVSGYYYHWNGVDNVVWTASAYIDTNGHLTIEDRGDNMSPNGEVYYEGDGYIGVYYVRIGNGNVPFFYLISEDGSVSRIPVGEAEDREIKHLENYSNIISITNTGGTQALLIDIEGNTYLDNGL